MPGGTQASTCCPLVRRSIGHKWKSVYVTNQSRRRKQRSRSQRRKIRRKEEGTGRVLPPPRWIAAAGDVLPPSTDESDGDGHKAKRHGKDKGADMVWIKVPRASLQAK